METGSIIEQRQRKKHEQKPGVSRNRQSLFSNRKHPSLKSWVPICSLGNLCCYCTVVMCWQFCKSAFVWCTSMSCFPFLSHKLKPIFMKGCWSGNFNCWRRLTQRSKQCVARWKGAMARSSNLCSHFPFNSRNYKSNAFVTPAVSLFPVCNHASCKSLGLYVTSQIEKYSGWRSQWIASIAGVKLMAACIVNLHDIYEHYRMIRKISFALIIIKRIRILVGLSWCFL